MARQVLLVQGSAVPASLHRSLCERSYTLVHLRDGQQALAWARQHQPALVLLGGQRASPESTARSGSDRERGLPDAHRGPDLSPADLCRSFKIDRATNLLPLILVGEPSARRACQELVVEPDAELTDPCCPIALPRALEQAVAAGRQRRAEETLAEVRFLLPSAYDPLEELSTLLTPWLTACGLGSHAARQMTLAVREVVANSIEWGHGYQRERLVSVGCRLDNEKVSILVRDSGPGFDRHNLPHAARPGDPLSHLEVRAERKLREGGFGILIASGMVDHLCYNDRGNEALLTRFLPLRPRQPLPGLTPGDPQSAPLQP
jgi:anti-sigma regulatory factor (Ser/Thr protein kinase)